MKKLPGDVLGYFEKRGVVIVSTIDPKGHIHCAAKGIVRMDASGKVYLLDLYHGQTFQNLRGNPAIAITAIDERHFSGYTLQGKAKVVEDKLVPEDVAKWEERVAKRITSRIIDSLQREVKSSVHPEAHLPKPKYLIVMSVDQIIDLSPPGRR